MEITRRNFIVGMGASGLAFSCVSGWSEAVTAAAGRRAGKKITLLNGGAFAGSVWGWQFTGGARIAPAPGRAGRRAIEVTTSSGDYARFLVLGPQAHKTYTLSGWVRTEGVDASEADAGAYFAAPQFEFQGRPTDFSVLGKQLPSERHGNYVGSTSWQRFSQTFTCLPGTTWFEVVAGIYRASGKAWFSDLTFVEGDQPADIDEVVDFWQAARWAHEDAIASGSRERPVAAILRDELPVRGAASDPQALGRILKENYQVEFLSAAELADPEHFNRAHFDLLVLPYGESFPLEAWKTVQHFLADGGDLFTTGGYAFLSPLVRNADRWEFYHQKVAGESGPNLLPNPSQSNSGWKASLPSAVAPGSALPAQAGSGSSTKVEIPAGVWEQNAEWYFDFPAQGDARQFYFEAWVSTRNVTPAPDGFAYVGVEQLDSTGKPAYAAKLYFERLRGSRGWHLVKNLFYLIPATRTLRVRIGLENATGMILGGGFRLEHRSPQVRLNTALGTPEDQLIVEPDQIGMFDADFRLRRAAAIRTHKEQSILDGTGGKIGSLRGAYTGYAATAVVGMDDARWIPLLEAADETGHNRGAAGALAYHFNGIYARGCWAFFGVENQDLFAAGSQFGDQLLRAVSRAMVRKCFLHACATSYASYRQGEPVVAQVLASNYGREAAALKLRWQIRLGQRETEPVFERAQSIKLEPGETLPVTVTWHPAEFAGDFYRVTAILLDGDQEIDRMEIGFPVWSEKTLASGLPFKFTKNYFQIDGKSLFLQGTDDYLHTFIDQGENPATWLEDAQGCHDSAIDVYENLMGLRGPQQRPTEAWWRWIDAMLLNVQRVGGAFFPGMLIFSNTAVSNKDLADQQAYVKAFAARYKDAAGIMYYLNGDLELHNPNLPDLQRLYHEYLLKKYGSDAALRAAWKISPPEAPIDKLPIRSGTNNWSDVRTLDDFRFRASLVRRWLNAMHGSIREADLEHPVTAEFYQRPTAGIDLLTALGKLELANFGYFNDIDEDFYMFPQTLKFLDQSLRGRGINVGEFGVKTHPAWRATGYYIEARTEAYEQAYFLAIAHYGFALGASKIQNWCWKYPADLPFEWGINYSNDLIPRDVRYFYRNSGLLFRGLRPRYEPSDTVVLIAGDNRMGGEGSKVAAGQQNAIRLLLDEQVRFSTLADDYLDSLPSDVKTIFYPLPYCPSSKIVERLVDFVKVGGRLYISGDISYDSLRQRTKTSRLKELCGVELVSERFPNIAYQHGGLMSRPAGSGWPRYKAAPGIVTRPAGAKVLLEGAGGTPIVTEFENGAGRVIFSADPIELHGDPRYQSYAHAFYHQLLAQMGLKGESFEPAVEPVHFFRVPSEDSRQIAIVVNHDQEKPIDSVSFQIAGHQARLRLGPRMSGAVVAEPGIGMEAIESSGDAFEDNRLIISSSMHFMAISFFRRPLLSSSRLLLLPMGQGKMSIPNGSRWKHPVVLAGEIAGSRWKQNEKFSPAMAGGGLHIPVTAARSLSVLIVCEAAEQTETIRQLEQLANAPWNFVQS